jgi:hypothetical protein
MIEDATIVKDDHMTDLQRAASYSQAACEYEAALSFCTQAFATGNLPLETEYTF